MSDTIHDDLDKLHETLTTLFVQREELERRVDDLRAFERDYRARLIAYHEGCLRDLRDVQ